jgi:hypothetical protein
VGPGTGRHGWPHRLGLWGGVYPRRTPARPSVTRRCGFGTRAPAVTCAPSRSTPTATGWRSAGRAPARQRDPLQQSAAMGSDYRQGYAYAHRPHRRCRRGGVQPGRAHASHRQPRLHGAGMELTRRAVTVHHVQSTRDGCVSFEICARQLTASSR